MALMSLSQVIRPETMPLCYLRTGYIKAAGMKYETVTMFHRLVMAVLM